MWKLKMSSTVTGEGELVETVNDHVGRQFWLFVPDPGDGARNDDYQEYRREVEEARRRFTENRFRARQSSDILMRLQFAREKKNKALKMVAWDEQRVGMDEETTAVRTTLQKALMFYSTLQSDDGFWPGDYGGPMFLLPGLVIGLYVTGVLQAVLSCEHQSEILRYLYNHQAARRRTLWKVWIDEEGSRLDTGSWRGNFYPIVGKDVAVLGLYDWSGNNPMPPELWLLPYALPIHPGRMWCHTRLVYLPMSYLYAKRYVMPVNSTVLSLRRELYTIPYHLIEWDKIRNLCAKEDLYYPHPWVQDVLWEGLQKIVEPLLGKWPFSKLRNKALDVVMEHIHYEDENTRYICIGPVNKVLNMVCCWVEDPTSEAFKRHLPRIKDYLWVSEDGMKMMGYGGSQLWDTAFAVQALLATNMVDLCGSMLKKAHDFIKNSQVRENSRGNPSAWHRHISKGGWPFSTADNGWIVSDCASEGFKAALLLSQMPSNIVGESIDAGRAFEAVNLILSLQNGSGGFASYELTRSYQWLEVMSLSFAP
ncbi:hypothetical protein MLD38_005962 [Melastoma candidum]|uniref:Uncharacterized protein n=1 Tax=Melastoma candidum TaxID=119954 RepID=A0ACB9RQ31_9MYRT|nr:hypothetical protein MLD38_005962 [Melastoma candidum]